MAAQQQIDSLSSLASMQWMLLLCQSLKMNELNLSSAGRGITE